MKQEIDQLWFRPYDEESYLHSFIEVNYQQYILIVVTDPNFDYFDKHAYEKKKYWDSGSIAFFQVLQILSDYFLLQCLDDRLMYIQEPHARKLAVKFRFWIDCERLYMLLFLGLDDNNFNQQRLTSSLFRLKRALLALFQTYKPAMFEQVKFMKFMSALKQQILVVQKTLNQRKETLVSLTKDSVLVINRVLRGEKVLEREAENQLFKRISKEIMQTNNNKAKIIEERLYNTVIVPQRINAEHEKLRWETPFMQDLLKDAHLMYDPVYLEMLQLKKQEQQIKKKNRKGLLQLAVNKDVDSKSRSIDKKDRISTRTKFRLHTVMNKSGNYPYTYKNILYNDFYADLVKVELDQAKQEEQDSDMENDLMMAYYDQDYLEKLRKADRNYAKVTKDDLVEMKEQQRVVKPSTKKVTVSYITWTDYPEEQDTISPLPTNTAPQMSNMNMGSKDEEQEEERPVEEGGEQTNSKFGQSKFCLNAVLNKMKNQGNSQIRYADQNRNKFNVYQSKHTRDTRGWGIVRSLYTDLKVNRKLSSFLKERTTYYYYVNRMGVWKKPIQVI